MVCFSPTKKEKERFEKFTIELAELSKKYGIAVNVTGGVYVYKKPEYTKNITYTDDASSGDLYFNLNDQER